MGLNDRVSRIVRANVTDISINKDPEHDLDHALLNMQANLAQMRQALISAMATHRRTQQQHTSALAEVDKWQKRADLALKNEKEELARQALTRSKTCISNAASLKVQLEQQASSVEMLKQNLISWENKVAEAVERRSLLTSKVDAVEINAPSRKTIHGSSAEAATTKTEQLEEELISQPRSRRLEKLDKADLDVLLGEFDDSCDTEAALGKVREMLGFTNAGLEQPKLLESKHNNSYEVLVAVNQLEQKLQQVVKLSQEAFQELAELKTQLHEHRQLQAGSTLYDNAINTELATLRFKLDRL